MTKTPYRVVAWGDSIAAGNADTAWPGVAERSCQVVINTGRPVQVINEAVCGKPAAHAVREFEARILPHRPDLVIIQFGFNDVRHDGSRGPDPLSTPEEFEQHLASMIRQCRGQAQADVIVLGNHRTRTNIRFPTGRTYEESRILYNAIARRTAAQAGVEFHDMSDPAHLPDATGWQELVVPDGVHLSPLGVTVYGRAIATWIMQHVTPAVPRPLEGRV